MGPSQSREQLLSRRSTRAWLMSALFIASLIPTLVLSRSFGNTQLATKAAIGSVTVALSVSALGYSLVAAMAGTSEPHILSWAIWSVVDGVAWWNQRAFNSGPGAWSTLAMTILSVAITVVAVQQWVQRHRHKDGEQLPGVQTEPDETPAEKKLRRLIDGVCLGGAVVCILVLVFHQTGVISIIIATVIDAFAFVPTLVKVWRKPRGETSVNYTFNVVRHLIVLFAIEEYNIVTLLFPISLLLFNAATALIILIKGRRSVPPASAGS